MADPVFHSNDTINPCEHCAGQRSVAEMAWRVPRFWVTCAGCGQLRGGETLAAATQAWNDANPDRELDPADEYQVALQVLRPHLTPTFVATLHAAAHTMALAHASDQVEDLLTWVTAEAPVPEGVPDAPAV